MAHPWKKSLSCLTPLIGRNKCQLVKTANLWALIINQFKLQNCKFKLKRWTFCAALCVHFYLFYFLTLTPIMVMKKKGLSYKVVKKVVKKEKNCRRRSDNLLLLSRPHLARLDIKWCVPKCGLSPIFNEFSIKITTLCVLYTILIYD